MTSGVRTIDGFFSGASGSSASKFSSPPHIELDGDHAVSFRRPLAIRACASPEETFWARTKTFVPSTSGFDALNLLTSGTSSFSFSGE